MKLDIYPSSHVADQPPPAWGRELKHELRKRHGWPQLAAPLRGGRELKRVTAAQRH